MLYRIALLGALICASLSAGPVQITINLSGGNFDRGVTTSGVDTGTSFTTSSAACSGAGCTVFSNISSLNSLLIAFTVPSGSVTGSGSVISGSLVQAQNINGFTFSGQSAFNANSTITENIGATSVLGDAGALTGTLTLNWSGNATSQARAATGTITLSGNINSTPEPSSALLLFVPMMGLLALRKATR